MFPRYPVVCFKLVCGFRLLKAGFNVIPLFSSWSTVFQVDFHVIPLFSKLVSGFRLLLMLVNGFRLFIFVCPRCFFALYQINVGAAQCATTRKREKNEALRELRDHHDLPYTRALGLITRQQGWSPGHVDTWRRHCEIAYKPHLAADRGDSGEPAPGPCLITLTSFSRCSSLRITPGP